MDNKKKISQAQEIQGGATPPSVLGSAKDTATKDTATQIAVDDEVSATSQQESSGRKALGDSQLAKALNTSRSYYWYLVLNMVLLSMLGSFVNDMYTPALPAMCKFFGCSISLAQLGLTMGMIGLALGQFIFGPVSDKIGRKKILIGSIALFTVMAIASVFSPNIHVFNLCRLLQGVGAAGGYFLARTIPTDVYGGNNLAKLMALVGAINGIAPASSPVIGGFVAHAWGWKGVFLVLAAFALILIMNSLRMKESLAPDRRLTTPLLKSFGGYVNLLKNKHYIVHVLLKGFALGILFAYISASPFILQNIYGLSQTQYGLVIGFNAIFAALGSIIAPKFHPFKKAATTGAFVLAISILGGGFCLWKIHNIWLFEAFSIIMVFALGMIFASANTLAMNEGRRQAGEASALLGIAGYVVGAIVSPLVGIGNILHSTAIIYAVLALVVLMLALMSRRIPADLDN